MCYPYCWSPTTDLSEIASFNKIYRFFLDDLFNTFAFEYMSTNPNYTSYNSVRSLARNYVIDYTGDFSYSNKGKVFSLRLIYKRFFKTAIYDDMSFQPYLKQKIKS